MNKRAECISFAFNILICLLLICLFVQLPSPAGSAQLQTIRIAAFNFYPTLFQAKDGSVQGFYVDFLQEIARREGWKIEYVYGNWSDGLARIKSGEVDLLTNVAFTGERAEFMDYGKVPLLTVWAEVYVSGGSSIDSIKNVKGKKIALMKGDFNAANFKNLVEKLEIPCTYVEVSNFEEVFKAIESGQVDAGVVNNTFGAAKQREYGVQSSGIVFNPFDIFFTSAKGKNRQILATLDKYLAEWRVAENSPYHQARERWSHKSVSIMKVTPASVWRGVTFILLTLCIAIAFVIVLRIQVRRKTSLLNQEVEVRKKAEEELNKYRDNLEELVKERTESLEQKTNELERSQTAIQSLLEEVTLAKTELETKIFQVERMNRLFVDRELRMAELKKEISLLKKESSGGFQSAMQQSPEELS